MKPSDHYLLSLSDGGWPGGLLEYTSRCEKKLFEFKALSYYGTNAPPPTPPPMTREVEVATFLRYKRHRNAKDREALLRQYLCWAFDAAAKFKGKRLDFDEAIAVANEGLREALEKFDPKKGFRFTTYAAFAIRRKLIEAVVNTYPVKVSDHIRKKWRNAIVSPEDLATQLIDNEPRTSKEFFERLGETGEVDLSEVYDRPADSPFMPSPESSPADQFEARSLPAEVRTAVWRLPRIEREAVRSRHYREPGESYEAIGERLGISKQQAKKAYESALVKLQKYFKKET